VCLKPTGEPPGEKLANGRRQPAGDGTRITADSTRRAKPGQAPGNLVVAAQCGGYLAVPSPPGGCMTQLMRWVRDAAYWAEDQFDWLLTNLVFPAQIVLVLLAGWGMIGADLGIERLFWSESWFVQLSCGFAV